MAAKPKVAEPVSTRRKIQDEETKAMLFEGASKSQLAMLFHSDIRKVTEKLHGCPIAGMRASAPIYSISEASRYLVEPIWPIDEYIQRMNHTDLPMMLRKEYWAGRRSEQIFMEQAGDLWRTDTVIEHISNLFKTISMSMRLIGDSVEREAGLNENQRSVVTRLIDQALLGAHREIEDMCSKQTPAKVTADDEL